MVALINRLQSPILRKNLITTVQGYEFSTSPVRHTIEMNEKVVLFIGVCDEIGVSSIIEFSRSGHRLAIVSQDIRELQEAIESCKVESQVSDANNYSITITDFKDTTNAEQAAKKLINEYGRIDILLMNLIHSGQARKLDNESFFQDFQTVLQMNLMFATRATQLVEPHLIQSRGNIIIVSSGEAHSLSYCVARAGLLMLTKTLANSFMHKGVRVNTIIDCAPGGSSSRVIQDEYGNIKLVKLVKFIVFLVSDKASYINGSIFETQKSSKSQNEHSNRDSNRLC